MNSFTLLPIETVFEFTESEDLAFRYIRSMEMDDYGNVLVTDPSQQSVFMFDTEGNLIQKIGRNGQGPGEFQIIGSILTAHDSLFVSDGSSHKIEVFEYRDTKYDHVRTVNIEDQSLLGNFLGLTEKGILIKNDIMLSPSRMNNPTDTAISLIGHGGEVIRDSLFSVPLHEFVVDDSNGPFVAWKIFGNTSQQAFDNRNKVYSLWSENLDLDYFTLEGEKQNAFSYTLTPVAITSAEQDSTLNLWENPQRDVMLQHMPDVKPIATNILVDDQQRIWVELLTEELEHGWYAFTPGGEPLFRIDKPRQNAFLQDIHGNKILWNYTKQDGSPGIVISTFQVPEK
ncbi:MAG: 6-bladed beta-propeller [Balneolaceae bacterium]|nr:6-bladed beta-propeller [Balneolaceae bacterium]